MCKVFHTKDLTSFCRDFSELTAAQKLFPPWLNILVPWVFALEITDGRFGGNGKLTVPRHDDSQGSYVNTDSSSQKLLNELTELILLNLTRRSSLMKTAFFPEGN